MSDTNLNNEKKEFEQIKKLLKDLPKVNTEDNFVYNLMTKIENKNFNLKTENSATKWFRWSFKPAVAVAFSVLILFFIFYEQPENADDPFSTIPLMISDYDDIADTIEIKPSKTEKKEKTSSLADRFADKETDEPEESYRIVLQPNDFVTKEKVDYPFDKGKSVDLDEYLRKASNKSTSSQMGELAGSGTRNDLIFRGFLLREREKKDTIDSLKPESDSLTQEKSLKETEK